MQILPPLLMPRHRAAALGRCAPQSMHRPRLASARSPAPSRADLTNHEHSTLFQVPTRRTRVLVFLVPLVSLLARSCGLSSTGRGSLPALRATMGDHLLLGAVAAGPALGCLGRRVNGFQEAVAQTVLPPKDDPISVRLDRVHDLREGSRRERNAPRRPRRRDTPWHPAGSLARRIRLSHRANTARAVADCREGRPSDTNCSRCLAVSGDSFLSQAYRRALSSGRVLDSARCP